MVPAVLLAVGTVVAPASAGGHRHGTCAAGYSASYAFNSCPPYWADPFADLRPWPFDNFLYDGPRNWTWWFPDGGFTAYPGEPGSGIVAGSDYSHINWVISPTATAQLVRQKLDALGIPPVPQETLFLGKNPAAVDKAKLPLPKSWMVDPDKDLPLENKDKDKDLDQ
jgi:hypothetical protein